MGLAGVCVAPVAGFDLMAMGDDSPLVSLIGSRWCGGHVVSGFRFAWTATLFGGQWPMTARSGRLAVRRLRGEVLFASDERL